MSDKAVKRYYITAGVFFGLAVIIGVIQIISIFMRTTALDFLMIYGIISLVISVLILIVMVIASLIIENQKKKDANKKVDDPEKLKKYASKKNR